MGLPLEPRPQGSQVTDGGDDDERDRELGDGRTGNHGGRPCSNCGAEGHYATTCGRPPGALFDKPELRELARLERLAGKLEKETRRELGLRKLTVEQWRDAPKAPATRGECVNGPRPCPYVRCRMWERGGLCAQDFADNGRMELSELAPLLGISKMGAFLVEKRAIAKLRRRR